MAGGREPSTTWDAENAVVVSGKTVDEAVATALQQLGLSRDEVEIEVLHAGSPGRLLGFGAEPARVRVTPLVGAEDDDQVRALGLMSTAAVPDLDVLAEEDEEDEADEDDLETLPLEAAGEAEIARQMLAELLARMGIEDATVQVESVDPVLLDVQGPDVADLIGRRGEHLRALQFLLGLMVAKQLRHHQRIIVDVDGYRGRREELLRNMAERFAQRVRATREAMQLETMPPNERRIIHMALADDPDVFTESVGEGDSRRVVIKPRS
ncbi:MAG TPA: RNA-binding cell elongation regulator Jag/EloR [Chloroflexota bacterium]|nr:RNA-binding cell elongation regulator Jag/EloR [Chloroflexota bacterium]